MNKRLQHKQKIYKRFNDDIWGQLAIASRYSKALQHVAFNYVNNTEKRHFYTNEKLRNFFIWKKDGRAFITWLHQARNSNINFSYNLKATDTEHKTTKVTANSRVFWDAIKLKKFYGDKRKKQFKFFKQSVNSNRRLSAPGVLTLLETRLDSVLFRSNLFYSVYEIRQYINHNKILINGKISQKQGISLNVGDIVSIQPELYVKLYNRFVTRLKNDTVLTNYPHYLEISYKAGCIFVVRHPRPIEVHYPFKKNIFANLHMYSGVMN